MIKKNNHNSQHETIEKRILIVHDNSKSAESLLKILLDILESHSYVVETAYSVKDASKRLQDFNAHLVLIDFRLGLSLSINLISELKAIKPELLCILMTSYADLNKSFQVLKEGAYDYLLKPVEAPDLLITLDRCFERIDLENEKSLAQGSLEKQNGKLTEINARLNLMVESTKAITSCCHQDKLNKLLLEKFARNMTTDGGSLFLNHGEGLELVHSLDTDHVPSFIHFPLSEDSILGYAIKELKPILIMNIKEEKKFKRSGWDGYNGDSLMVLPMISEKQKLIGIFSFHNKRHSPFTKQDLEFGLIFASLCTGILRNLHVTKALHESEERYSAIVEDQTEYIVRFLPDGKLTFVNEAYCRYYGQPCERFIGNSFFISVLEDDRKLIQDKIDSLTFENTVVTYEHRVALSDGTIAWQKWVCRAIVDNNGRLAEFQSVGRDISKRKKMEEALLQSEKLKSIGIVTAGIVHEFNNVLAIISGNVQLLESRYKGQGNLADRLCIIKKATDDGSEISGKMLRFTRTMQGATAFVSYDIRELIEQSIDFTMPRWKNMAQARGIDYYMNKDGMQKVSPISCNPTELREVFINIINNAMDAMPAGGRLTFSTWCNDETVFINISDTGAGMSAEVKKRVFEPFFTTKFAVGTGLGMSTAYGIIARHGGKIDVESELGKGCTFTLEFPVAVKTVSSKEPPIPEQEANGNGLSILVVDDDGGDKVATLNYEIPKY